MFHRHRTAFLFGFYSLLSLAFLSWSADHVVHSLKLTFYSLWSPLGNSVVHELDQLGRFGGAMADLFRAKQRALDFEERWIQDRLDMARLNSLEEENNRLTGLLGVSVGHGFRATAARVWARDPADWFHSVLVQHNSEIVSLGDAVITVQEGRPVILGQVQEILPDQKARVLLLTDPFSALSAQVGRTGEQGLVEGRGGARLLLNYLYADSKVQPGDEVFSAGLGGVYPAHLLIGQITDVVDPIGASSKRAAVSPAARLGFVRDVLILSPQNEKSVLGKKGS